MRLAQNTNLIGSFTTPTTRLNRRSFIVHCSNSSQNTTPQSTPSWIKEDPDRRTLLVGSLFALSSRLIANDDNAFAATTTSSAEALQRQLQSRVHEFTLSNGLKFFVSERRSAPVVSFHSYVDVGAFDEQQGLTGVAHLLEHAISKGTARIGTADYKKEAMLLDAMDDVFYASLSDAHSGHVAAELAARLRALQEEASKISAPNAYGALLQKEGAVGLNAQTTHDSTQFYCSLPSNKTELWFSMESERFQAPVFRDLYQEKKVVLEERRMRVENSPLGPFQEEFAARSLTNNYRRPVIGYEMDIERLGRKEVASFFNEHYGPTSMSISIVGDVRVEQIRQYAEKYFGGWRATGTAGKACNGDGIDEEPLPRPDGNRHLRMQTRAGPAVLRAYYRPCIKNRLASTAMDVLSDTLSGSRSSRLYKNLVLTGKALSASSFSSFPAEKHPSQMALYGMPVPGVTSLEDLDRYLHREIEDVVQYGPTDKELQRYRAASRIGVLESLQSNGGFASLLNSYHALTGDWRMLCRDIEDVESLTSDKVRDGVAPYIYQDNSFVGYADAKA